MAKTKKKDIIKGYFEGKSHYTMEGKDFIKSSSAPDPKRLANDPEYAKVRVNNKLFGSTSTLASSFRKALPDNFKGAMNSRMHGSLTSMFRSIVSDNRDILNLRLCKNTLLSFSFRDNYFFDGMTKSITYELQYDEGRSKVTLLLLPFKQTRLKKGRNYTHFRMTLAILPFADCKREEGVDSVRYLPEANAWHTKIMIAESSFINRDVLKQKEKISVSIPNEARLEHMSLVVFLHLAFYEEVNGKMYGQGSDVMKVADVM